MTSRQRLGWGLVGALLTTITVTAPGMAQSGRTSEDMWRELNQLKQGQNAILRELQELRVLILGAARGGAGPRADVAINVNGAAFQGSPTAPVTLVEFSDYQ